MSHETMCVGDGNLAKNRWRSILRGTHHRAGAQEAAGSILGYFADLGSEAFTSPDEQAEIALALAYGRHLPEGDFFLSAFPRHLDDAIDRLGELGAHPFLYQGFLAVAWIVEHLRRLHPDAFAGSDPNAEIDQALFHLLKEQPTSLSYELVYGLAGIGTYALERPPGQTYRNLLLERIVELLAQSAVAEADGLSWRTGQPGPSTTPFYNLGMAHGVPGVISFLGEVVADGSSPVATERAEALLERTVPWLLARRLPEGGLPPGIGNDEEPSRARLAWCYGGCGAAAGVMVAAIHTGRVDWQNEALEMACEAARRDPESSGVEDPGLCHGAVGVAHIFNRMFQATGDAELRQAALRWYADTLAYRDLERGLCGFAAQGTKGLKSDRGFLIGIAGIALAFVAALSDQEPAWDRRLMTSVPVRLSRSRER